MAARLGTRTHAVVLTQRDPGRVSLPTSTTEDQNASISQKGAAVTSSLQQYLLLSSLGSSLGLLQPSDPLPGLGMAGVPKTLL